jgi:ACT domain-containing protein
VAHKTGPVVPVEWETNTDEETNLTRVSTIFRDAEGNGYEIVSATTADPEKVLEVTLGHLALRQLEDDD